MTQNLFLLHAQICTENTPDCVCKKACHPNPVARLTPCACAMLLKGQENQKQKQQSNKNTENVPAKEQNSMVTEPVPDALQASQQASPVQPVTNSTSVPVQVC